jgi:hypothetical protein
LFKGTPRAVPDRNESRLSLLGQVVNAIPIQGKFLTCPTMIKPNVTSKPLSQILRQAINFFFKKLFSNKIDVSHEHPSLMQDLELVLQERLVEHDIQELSFRISHSTPMLIFL